MNRITIFVEGAGDVKFIKDFISEHFKYKLSGSEIIDVKGKDKLPGFTPLMKEISDNNGNNIVIFDADYPETGGGFQNRCQDLNRILQENSIQFSYYLFPNNSLDGDLETLLEQVINPINRVIFDCWTQYESCLISKNNLYSDNGNFTIPAKKSKIYSYLECLLPNTKKGKEKVKDPKRNYLNTDHWHINDLHNPYVRKLKDFLSPFFQEG